MSSILETVGPRAGAAPLTYTLAETGTVDLQAVFAHFNGAAASGAFRPALTIRSQNGTIIARLFPTDELAAGDSCDVSYVPFFRRSTSTPAGRTFAQVVAALAVTRDLRGYWRLGEGASPYADTSGNAGGPKDMVRLAQGTAMTQDYTPGALPPAQDDGAVKFNAATYSTQADVLRASDTRFRLTGIPSWTVSAWVKPTLFSSQLHQVVGTFSPSNGGYALAVSGLTGTVVLLRGDAGGTATLIGPSIPLDAWTFVVGVYGPTTGAAKIYVNGALAASHTVVQGMGIFNTLVIGGNGSGGPVYASLNGGVDEVSVWGEALSAVEIGLLATAAGL